MKNLKIAVIDDHRAIHFAFKHLESEALQEASWIKYYYTGHDFLNDLSNTDHIPDIAIVDMNLTNEMNGIDLINILSTDYPEIRSIVLSMNCETLFIEHGIRAGALGYLSKGFDKAELVSCLKTVRQGKVHLNKHVTRKLLDNINKMEVDKVVDLKTPLTDREKEVLRLIVKGLTYKEIADELHLGKRTVETHKNNLCEKIGLKRVPELVKFAVQIGLY